MIIKKITVLTILFIFCIVPQIWADRIGTSNRTFFEGSIIKMNKLEERHQPGTSNQDDREALDDAFSGSPKAHKKLKLIESIEKIFSIYKFRETTWRNKFLGPEGMKETKSVNSEYRSSILDLHSNVNRYLEEDRTRVIFELFQSKLKKTEIFILFHLSFDRKGEQMLLEMHLTPSSDKGVNFFIPF